MVLINEDVAMVLGKSPEKGGGGETEGKTSMQMQMTFIKMREFGGV